jgi:hypothetical protein
MVKQVVWHRAARHAIKEQHRVAGKMLLFENLLNFVAFLEGI